jgi:uncharacterized protein (TIGR02453 family)
MKQILDFLKKLAKNNKTVWMHANRETYLASREQFTDMVQQLIVKLNGWEKDMPMLEPKACIFRQNRDIRFSDNKDPYKKNMSAVFSKEGKKSSYPCYYFHVEPGKSFVAGGVWMPDAELMRKIRRHIAENGDQLKKIMNTKKFKDTYGAFSVEQKLVRPPAGYGKDHPHLELLLLKSFTVSVQLSDKEMLDPQLLKKVDQYFKVLAPMNHFLAEAFKKDHQDFSW